MIGGVTPASSMPQMREAGGGTGAGGATGSTGLGGSGGGASGRDAQIEETGREHAQIRQPVVHLRIVQQGEQFAELGFCGGVVLPVEGRLGRGIPPGGDLRQEPLPHFAECRAHARRCVGFGGHEQRIDRDHGGDGALGFGPAAEREQAERPVLLDGLAIGGLRLAIGRPFRTASASSYRADA